MDPEDQIEDVNQSTQESFGVSDSSQEDDSPKVNPAWQETLDQIPEEFHPVLLPKFTEWDGNFQGVQQRYAPFKEFADNQISPDVIKQSIQIRDLFENNPRGVYDFLQNTYNFGAAPTGQAEQESQSEEEFHYDENQVDLSKHPEFAAMAQKVSQFETLFAEQQKQEVAQHVDNLIENDFRQIATKYAGGNLDDQAKIDIARLAMGAGDNDLLKAAGDYFTRFRAAPRNPAPPVLKGNGRIPQGVTLDDIAKMDSEQRIEHVAAMMKGIVESD